MHTCTYFKTSPNEYHLSKAISSSLSVFEKKLSKVGGADDLGINCVA